MPNLLPPFGVDHRYAPWWIVAGAADGKVTLDPKFALLRKTGIVLRSLGKLRKFIFGDPLLKPDASTGPEFDGTLSIHAPLGLRGTSMANALQRDDHVYGFTRHLAVIIIPFLLLFLSPQAMIAVRPWTPTPLTARIVGVVFALPGLVGLGIALDKRLYIS